VLEGEGPTVEGFEAPPPGDGPFRRAADPRPVSQEGICRFLASESAAGDLGAAIPGVDPANRCVAIAEPIPQSGRQQELVCLTGAHVNCPRYLRGVLIAGTPPPAPPREPISRAVIGAVVVLVAALAVSFGFLAVHGGIAVELPSGPPTQVAVVTTTPSPAAATDAPPSAAATPPPWRGPTGSPSASPAPSPSPSPSPTPTTTPRPTPARTPTPTAVPSSDRFAVLTRCASTADCWVYVIRAGDNLRSIVNWFGVSYDRVLRMNPAIADPTTIHAGQQLRIPTPTR
jgi:hypothetical protein